MRGLGSFHLLFRADNLAGVLAQTGTGRDEVTNDYVLLQAQQLVGLATDGGFAQHLGRLLETRGRDERLRAQRGLRDALQRGARNRRLRVAHLHEGEVAAFQAAVLVAEATGRHNLTGLHVARITGFGHHFHVDNHVVLGHEDDFINHLVFEERRVTGIQNHHFLHHLANNHLDVLIVDFHTLQAVHFLNLVHEVLLHGTGALNAQDVGRRDGTIRQRHAGADKVVVLHQNVLRQRHHVLLLDPVFRLDVDFPVTAFHGAVGYYAVDFRYHGGVRRVPGFEKLRYPRQTTGDVAGFAHRARNLGEDVTSRDFLVVLHVQVRAHRDAVGLLAFGIALFAGADDDGRVLVLGLRLDDYLLAVTGLFVRFLTERDALRDGIELHGTIKLGQNNGVVRVPVVQLRAFFHFLAFLHEHE